MSDTPITERQQHWLDHIQAAETFDGSIADYARSEGLKPKELYQWKTLLSKRGLLNDAAAAATDTGFVRVIAPARPLGMSLVLPNGVDCVCAHRRFCGSGPRSRMVRISYSPRVRSNCRSISRSMAAPRLANWASIRNGSASGPEETATGHYPATVCRLRDNE